MAIYFQSPLKPINLSPHSTTPLSHKPSFLISNSLSSNPKTHQTHLTKPEPEPVLSAARAFAPATIANLGPGFDFLGCAVDGLGDYVTISIDPTVHPGQISITQINGSDQLSKDPIINCSGISALATMNLLGIHSVGLSLRLDKGLPLGSGLGSSAASAAAAATAVNALFGGQLSTRDLINAGLESETKVSGYHADNIAPAIMGGFVLIRNYQPLELIKLDFPHKNDIFFVLVSPEFQAPTKKMRAVLPSEIGMPHHVWNSSQAAALVAAVLRGDVEGLGVAMSADKVVEPRRAPLIPGMGAVKKAALVGGAFGCTISGAGPTAVAVTDREEKGREIGERMVEAFWKEGGLKAVAVVKRLDRVGARVVSSTPR